MTNLRIAVLGAGYVGLVSAACLAKFGHDVRCIDVDRSKIDRLLRGEVHFFEPGLEELVRRGRDAGRLAFTNEPADGLRNAEVAFIAVGTPPRPRDGEADLTFVIRAAEDILRNAARPITIVTKSTVPVGTGDMIEKRAARLRPDLPVSVVSNPEFLREGCAIQDFLTPDRIVIGANASAGREAMRGVYEAQIAEGVPFLETERRTAELIKYAANAFLATKIVFANEMADLCEEIGCDVEVVARGMGLDARIGTSFLKAGPGYGGSCFPKDTLALMRTAQDVGVSLRIVQEAVASNDARKRMLGRRVAEAVNGDMQGKTIAVLGVAFKANTDDIRETPAAPLIDSLLRMGAKVRAYDPQARRNAERLFDEVEFAPDALACAAGADALVIATEWEEFRTLDLTLLAKRMNDKVIVDFRNMLNRAEAERLGFTYAAIGRPAGRPVKAGVAGGARPSGQLENGEVLR